MSGWGRGARSATYDGTQRCRRDRFAVGLTAPWVTVFDGRKSLVSGSMIESDTRPKDVREKRKAKGKPKLSSRNAPLKKLKSWKQIAKLDFPLDDWPAFRQSIATRLSLIHWRTQWDGKRHPLEWAGNAGTSERSATWQKKLETHDAGKLIKPRQQQLLLADLQEWCQECEPRLVAILEEERPEPDQDALTIAREALTAAWLLPWVSQEADDHQFRPVLETLVRWGQASWDPELQPVMANLLGVELPMVLSFQFPDLLIQAFANHPIVDRLTGVMDPCLDGNGMPSAETLPRFGPLLASWTRSYQLSQFMGSPIFTGLSDDQYQWAARQYLRLLRSDGSVLLTDTQKGRSDRDFLTALLHCDDDLEDWQAAVQAFPGVSRDAPGPARRGKTSRLPDAADETEWGKLAILRSKWKAKSDKLAVDFHQRDVHLELENHRGWLKGPMATELRVDGEMVQLSDDWTEVCWHSDDDAVYLEIQNQWQGAKGLSGVVQRQFLLARYHRFCLISDSVLLSEDLVADAHSIDHHWTLPLADKVSYEAAAETHEGALVAGKHQLSFLPLTLPEWRVEFSRGSVSTDQHQLKTHYSLPSGRLYQAVLIDLDHRRSREPLTWRHLVVGEDLKPVTIDTATGFRVQLDRMQYLFYRSLAPIVGRTLLGHNYYCDFYAGQFQPNGLCEDIMMVNGPEDE